MDPHMLFQLESQSKRHRVLVDGEEKFSGDVLLVALQKLNQAIQKFGSSNVEFESVCTDGGKKQ